VTIKLLVNLLSKSSGRREIEHIFYSKFSIQVAGSAVSTVANPALCFGEVVQKKKQLGYTFNLIICLNVFMMPTKIN